MKGANVMKCERHPASEIDGTCEECGREICKECRVDGEPVCKECLENAPIEGQEDKDVTTNKCHECGTPLTDEDKQLLGDNYYCRTCVDKAKQNISMALEDMKKNVAWPTAILAGLVVAVAGALVWWLVEARFNIRLGIIAIAIGYGAGYAVVMGSGGKRGIGLQVLSVLLTLLGIAGGLFLSMHDQVAKAMASGMITDIPKGADWQATAVLFPILITHTSIMTWAIIVFGLWQAFVIPGMPKINLDTTQQAA